MSIHNHQYRSFTYRLPKICLFVDFFIKRPIFATVCGLIILIVGLISIPTLPIARFPDITPTQISVTANYSGASAEVVESGVTNILERQINGVEGLRYITSSSSNDGSTNITATFDSSRNKDIAAVDVQNRVSVANPNYLMLCNARGLGFLSNLVAFS